MEMSKRKMVINVNINMYKYACLSCDLYMEGISFTAHVSNKKSAITSKSKLAGVAKHNLRKYKSEQYSADNIFLIYGTDNLVRG